MRRFYLNRKVDVTGVSGTGKIAEGVVFSSGWVAMTWTTTHTSLVFYQGIEDVIKIHGHGNLTEVVFIDP